MNKIILNSLLCLSLIHCTKGTIDPLVSNSSPNYKLEVDGKTNCILLNGSVAAFKNIPIGNYNVQVAGNAYAKILNVCSKLNMKAMADDVAPFLFNAADAKKVELFEKYLKQVEL